MAFFNCARVTDFRNLHVHLSSSPIRRLLLNVGFLHSEPRLVLLYSRAGRWSGGNPVPLKPDGAHHPTRPPRSNYERTLFLGRPRIHVPPAIKMVVDLCSSADHAAVQEHVERSRLEIFLG